MKKVRFKKMERTFNYFYVSPKLSHACCENRWDLIKLVFY